MVWSGVDGVNEFLRVTKKCVEIKKMKNSPRDKKLKKLREQMKVREEGREEGLKSHKKKVMGCNAFWKVDK